MEVLIRFARESDADRIASIYYPSVVGGPVSFEVEAPGAEEIAQRMRDAGAQYPWLVWTRDGEVHAYAYSSAHRTRAAYQWSVDVSVYVDHRMQRQGIGRALYRELLALLAQQGFKNAYAGITESNVASVAMHLAEGFKTVGVYRGVGYKLGAWHDVGWYWKCLAPTSGAPSPLESLAQIDAARKYDAAPPELTRDAKTAERKLTAEFEIRPLSDSPHVREALSDILIEVVADGGSVSFMHPLTLESAGAFWRESLAAAARDERIVLGAWAEGTLAATVTVLLNFPPNQPHRAEIAKLMTRRRSRGRGIATALMREAERLAIERQRSLLVLDTATEGGASRLYEHMGYTFAGEIPAFALKPHGGLTGTKLYWKRIGANG